MATRRPHCNTSAGSDAHQRSFTRAGDRPNAASELRDLTSQKQSRAHEEAGASKWNYFSLMCK